MLYSYSEAISLYKTDYLLKKAVFEKAIFKIEKGVYSDGKDNFTLIELILKKYKQAFLVKESALYNLRLITDPPSKVHIGTPRNAVRIRDKRVTQHFYSDFNKDVVEIYGCDTKHILSKNNLISYYTNNGNEIRLLNLEALLFDCIRDRNKYTEENFKELLFSFKEYPYLYNLDLFHFEDNLVREKIKYDSEVWKELKEIEERAWERKWEKEFEDKWRL